MEYLQTAAIEAIHTMRGFLDLAESIVRDPETAAAVGRAFAEAAASVLRPQTPDDDGTPAGSEAPDEQHHTGLRRINLTD